MSQDARMKVSLAEEPDCRVGFGVPPGNDGSVIDLQQIGSGAGDIVSPGFQGAWWAVSIVALIWLGTLLLAFDSPGELFASNWPITPIAFVAAAFANATAIGGGFLLVPLFIFAYGLSPIAALKLSLATQAFGMSSGALGWSRRFIVIRALVIAGIASGVGMVVGTYVITISNDQVKSIFAWVSLCIFVVILLEIRFGAGSAYHDIRNDTLLKSSLFALSCMAGGMVTAWTAIGIGEVVALYLLFVYRIRIDVAIGTGVAVLAIDSIIGLLFHTHIGGIVWEYLVQRHS